MGFIAYLLRGLGENLVEVVFPRSCYACGAHFTPRLSARSKEDRTQTLRGLQDGLDAIFRQVCEPFLCPDCLTAFDPVASPLCSRCGVMYKSRIGNDHLCGECLKRKGNFRHARAAGIYGDAIMGLIHRFKYKGCLVLAEPLARLLEAAFNRYWAAEEIDMVLPIPLHQRRLRGRGFNQAAMLVLAWKNLVGQDHHPVKRWPMNRTVLIRARSTKPQTGLGKVERRRNIRKAFKVADRDAVRGRRILLVDDVYTTGITVEEAAGELLGNGAMFVDVLTIARTMPHSRWRYARSREGSRELPYG